MLSFKKSLNWYLDDGINLVMINDWVRNNFFEQSMINTVMGKNCVDVGFGTGLLSILACKHGAKHITAFESDVDRYELGSAIIEELNLQDKIQLINDHYFHAYPTDAEVMFTETLSGDIWGEGLLDSIPRHKAITMIPDQCFAYFLAIPVSTALIDRMMIQEHDPDIFNPLVDIDNRFVDLINGIIDDTWRDKKNLDSIAKVRQHWQDISSRRQIKKINLCSLPREVRDIYERIITSAPIGKTYYRVNFTNRTVETSDANGVRIVPLNFENPQISLNIDLSAYHSPAILLVCRPGISYKKQTLMLDRCENWGLPQCQIYQHPYNKITVTHDMITGQLNL